MGRARLARPQFNLNAAPGERSSALFSSPAIVSKKIFENDYALCHACAEDRRRRAKDIY
jgi:hypothetical protein